jgi:hypothetical protein
VDWLHPRPVEHDEPHQSDKAVSIPVPCAKFFASDHHREDQIESTCSFDPYSYIYKYGTNDLM